MRPLARAAQAPLERFFDPRFTVMLQRLEALERATTALDQRIGALDSRLVDRVDELTDDTRRLHTEAAEWLHALAAGIREIGPREALAEDSPHAADPEGDALLTAAVGAAAAALPAGATALVAGMQDEVDRLCGLLAGLGVDAPPPDPSAPADLVVVPNDDVHRRDAWTARVRQHTVLVARGAVTADGVDEDLMALGPSWEQTRAHLLVRSDLSGGWRRWDLGLDALGEVRRDALAVVTAVAR